ncbi:MAG: hypothetical protein ABFC96_05305 [Thermoguttaceae bacterium]
MKRALLSHGRCEIIAADGIDFVMHAADIVDVVTPGNVRTYCTDPLCSGMAPVMSSPASMADQIRATIRPGVRAMVGNAGPELTFRHIVSRGVRNVHYMLRWADAAYELLGPQMVLAPMEFDLVDDVRVGGRLLAWAAEHRVPLAIFCGFRFLFREDAFDHIREVAAAMPMEAPGNPYRYPYAEISDAIRRTGAEVWTGVGYAEGLAAGAIELAEQFGMSAVFTTQEAWDCWNQSKAAGNSQSKSG